MFYLPMSKIVDSSEAAVAPGAVILAEGQALVRQPGAAAAGVMPSEGAAGEIFCGFAIAGVSAAPFAEGYTNKVEHFVVPASGKVSLQFAPLAGQFSVTVVETNKPAAGATLAGKVIEGLTAGVEVKVVYKYALSVVQARALYGDVQPGGYAGAQVGQIGQFKRGVIYTSEFDASVDWAAATAIKLAPNGQLTDQSGAGEKINAVVVGLPNMEVPYLGIEFTAL